MPKYGCYYNMIGSILQHVSQYIENENGGYVGLLESLFKDLGEVRDISTLDRYTMEDVNFFTKYGSKVYITYRRDVVRTIKIMQKMMLNNPKFKVTWSVEVFIAFGNKRDLFDMVNLQNTMTSEMLDLLPIHMHGKPQDNVFLS